MEDRQKIEEIFLVNRNKVSKIEGAGNIFVTYSKIETKPWNMPKLKLRITNYFPDVDICFRKAVIKSKRVYFIHANANTTKIQNIKIKILYYAILFKKIFASMHSTNL